MSEMMSQMGDQALHPQRTAEMFSPDSMTDMILGGKQQPAPPLQRGGGKKPQTPVPSDPASVQRTLNSLPPEFRSRFAALLGPR